MLNQVVNSLHFFISIELISILAKIFILTWLLFSNKIIKSSLNSIRIFLILILLGALLEDLAWIVNTLEASVLPNIDSRAAIFLLRVAWIFTIVQYQSFSLFIENLIPNQSKKLFIINRIFLIIGSIYSSILLWLTLFKPTDFNRFEIEYLAFEHISHIYIPTLTITCLIFTLIRLRDTNIPDALRQQLYTFTLGLIGPIIISDTIQIYQLEIIPNHIINNYAVIALSSLVITGITYLCINHMVSLDYVDGYYDV